MKFIKASLAVLVLLSFAVPVLAAKTTPFGEPCQTTDDCWEGLTCMTIPGGTTKSCLDAGGASGSGIPGGTGGAGGSATCSWSSGTNLCNPLKVNTPQGLIGLIINGLLGVVGSLALIMFIYGGFLWMTSAGKEASVEKGKNILLWSTLGLIVIFLSYALVRFVLVGIGA